LKNLIKDYIHVHVKKNEKFSNCSKSVCRTKKSTTLSSLLRTNKLLQNGLKENLSIISEEKNSELISNKSESIPLNRSLSNSISNVEIAPQLEVNNLIQNNSEMKFFENIKFNQSIHIKNKNNLRVCRLCLMFKVNKIKYIQYIN
jgi:hypothetical protein